MMALVKQTKRERRLMRRAHRRLIRENIWYECGCTPRCDWYAPPELKNETRKLSETQSRTNPYEYQFCLEPTGPQYPNVATNATPSTFVPLSFWFCEDPRSSIPWAATMSPGQTMVSFTIEPIENTGG